MVKEYKIYKNKGSREAQNLPRGMIALGTD